VRWFHTGGIFSALSKTTHAVAREAMEAAKRFGTAVSYDCNYRPSLWEARGGRQVAAAGNRALVPFADVLFGHEGDLALDLDSASHALPGHTKESYAAMAARTQAAFPNLIVIATPTRNPRTANRNDWGGLAYRDNTVYVAPAMENLEILDRVGGGDSFAAGVIYGLLAEEGMEWALRCGVAHGALTMTTAGDNSYVSLAEVTRLMGGHVAGVQR